MPTRRLEPGCLERLATALQADASLGGVQPLILQLERGRLRGPTIPSAVVYSVGQALTRGRAGPRRRERASGRGITSAERREIFGVCGAACLLRRELLVELGGYDERYFAFCEDVDLNVRARVAGWRFQLEPAAVVWHLGRTAWSAGFARPEADNARLVARNRLATQIKFMPARSTPRIALVEAGALARAARQGGCSRPSPASSRRFAGCPACSGSGAGFAEAASSAGRVGRGWGYRPLRPGARLERGLTPGPHTLSGTLALSPQPPLTGRAIDWDRRREAGRPGATAPEWMGSSAQKRPSLISAPAGSRSHDGDPPRPTTGTALLPSAVDA